jgi:hypothetical protein
MNPDGLSSSLIPHPSSLQHRPQEAGCQRSPEWPSWEGCSGRQERAAETNGTKKDSVPTIMGKKGEEDRPTRGGAHARDHKCRRLAGRTGAERLGGRGVRRAQCAFVGLVGDDAAGRPESRGAGHFPIRGVAACLSPDRGDNASTMQLKPPEKRSGGGRPAHQPQQTGVPFIMTQQVQPALHVRAR